MSARKILRSFPDVFPPRGLFGQGTYEGVVLYMVSSENDWQILGIAVISDSANVEIK